MPTPHLIVEDGVFFTVFSVKQRYRTGLLFYLR